MSPFDELSGIFHFPSLSHHLSEVERPLLTLPLPSVEHVASSLCLSFHVFKMGIMMGSCRKESVRQTQSALSSLVGG